TSSGTSGGARSRNATTQPTRTTARAMMAHSKYENVITCVHPFIGPEFAPNQEKRVTNTAMSVSSNATNHRRSGSASANQGSSHRLYWGEYTLFESRNTTRIGNPSCHLGVPA